MGLCTATCVAAIFDARIFGHGCETQPRTPSGLREKTVNNLKHSKSSESMKLDVMLAIFNLGGGEIILILAGALILFGGKKLPELARGLGQGIREFKKATGNASEEMRQAIEPVPVVS